MKEKILSFGEKDEHIDVGDNIDFSIYHSKLNITLENPWYGDSESGFGATLSISLDKEQVIELIDFLKTNFV